MARKKQTEGSIDESPLLSKQTEAESSNRMSSQIHPDRFDMSRFSEMREEEESSIRIVIYVIVVIAIGVGLAFLVRFILANQSTPEENTNSPEVIVDNIEPTAEIQTEETQQNIIISTATLADSNAVNPINDIESFQNIPTQIFGVEDTNISEVILDSINYQKYQSFTRVIFDFNGISNSLNLPASTFDYTDAALVITFNDLITINDTFTSRTIVNDLVSFIDISNNVFTLSLREPVEYAISSDNSQLFIDFKTTRQLESMQPSTESSIDTESDTTSSNDENNEPSTNESDSTTEIDPINTTDTSNGTSTDNLFSQDTQYVRSNLRESTLEYNETYYADVLDTNDDGTLRTYFELAWGSRRNVGSEFIPNASAELIQEGETYFIEIEIENLSQFAFEELTAATLPINTDRANFVKAETTDFTNGKATIKVELKNQADFRLISSTTLSGQTQIIALQIAD